MRWFPVERAELPREMRTVETPFGTVKVKVARLPDGGERAAPEFEDCREAAVRAGVSVLEVMEAALRLHRRARTRP